MRLKVAICTVLCTILCNGVFAGPPNHQWTINLNLLDEVRNAGPMDANSHVLTAYLGRDRIAVGLLFLKPTDGRFPPERDRQTHRAILLMLEASTGRVLHSYRFDDFYGESADKTWLRILPDGDELLVSYGNDLIRFNRDLEPLAQRKFHSESQDRHGINYYAYWWLLVNQKDDKLLLIHGNLDGTRDVRWLNRFDLSDLALADAPNPNLQSAFPAREALVGSEIIYSETNVQARQTNVMVQTGNDARQLGPDCHGIAVTTFGRELIFLEAGQKASHAVIDMKCDKLYERSAGHGADRILAVSGAADANRVVFTYGSLRGSLFGSWHSSDHVVVLDVDAKREIEIPASRDYGIKVEENSQVFGPIVLALSPDGKSLAVAKGSSVQLWSIP